MMLQLQIHNQQLPRWLIFLFCSSSINSLISHESLTKLPRCPEIISLLQSWWWISNKAGRSQSRSRVSQTAEVEHPKETLESNTGEPAREWDWMDIELKEVVDLGVGGWRIAPLRWPDYSLNRMSSHNKGFIITSWRVAAVWELCTAVFSARPPKNVAQLCFGRAVQTTTNPVFVSL